MGNHNRKPTVLLCLEADSEISQVMPTAIITARVRSTREGNIFSLFVCSHRGGGVPTFWVGGVPTFPGLDGGGGYLLLGGGYLPSQVWMGGGGYLPSQVWMGGYLLLGGDTYLG